MEYHFVSARKNANVMKNGDNPVLTLEAFRVHLMPKPGQDGSDYVNASWFLGLESLHDYIVSGVPCDVTVVDFWQMLWERHVHTVAVFVNFEQEVLTKHLFEVFTIFIEKKKVFGFI